MRQTFKKGFSLLLAGVLVAQVVVPSFAATQSNTATKNKPTTTAVATTTQSPLAKQIDGFLAEALKQGNFSGTVILAKDGKTLLSKSYGNANEEYKIPANSKTMYRLASLSKQLTAASVLKLQEAGKLNLNDPVGQYIPNFPSGDQITIKMLLNHTSGLRDNIAGTGKTAAELSMVPHTPAELASLIAKETLGSKPGETYFYSNHGYILLGYIIERVSGVSYETYVKQNILTPLGITDIQLDNTKAIVLNRAEGYSVVGGKKVKADAINMSNAYAAGGWLGTADAYLKWIRSYNSTKILKPESWQAMFERTVETKTNELLNESYGLGVMLSDIPVGSESVRAIYHTGGVNGFRNFEIHLDRVNIDFVLLCNNESLNLQTFLYQLILCFMGMTN